MRVGIRELKDGALSRVIERAKHGEEVIVTDRGRPVARIVSFEPGVLPESVSALVAAGRLDFRIPTAEPPEPMPMGAGRKDSTDYVSEERR